MRYPDQSDYSGDRELVPNSLRLYRHYRLALHKALPRLGPTAIGGVGVDDVKPGWNRARCHALARERADRGCRKCGGRGEIITRRKPLRDFDFYDLGDALPDMLGYVDKRNDCDCLVNCKAPRAGCRCGFYASYSPKTNFFSQYIEDAQRYRIPSGGSVHVSVPTVFAVVEAAGRVLMGSAGVRAERMRVVAAAIDTHHAEVSGYKPGLIMGQVEMLRFLASDLGMKSYDFDIRAMIADFPQPDLSALIDNQIQPPPPERIQWRG